MNDAREWIDELVEELKEERDKLRVRVHLAKMEADEEWEELEDKMEEFSGKAKQFAGDAGIRETGEGLGRALGQLGNEIKLGYERIRKAIRDE